MVDGNDIANINGLYEEAKDEKNYVWNDLLKGPDGCEQEIYNTWLGKNPWQISFVKRPSYPFPILYDYNNYHKGDTLPNAPNPAIPGVTFTSLSTYQNKEALNPSGPTNFNTFLSTAFMVGDSDASGWGPYSVDSNGNRNFPNVFWCQDFGISCGHGHYIGYNGGGPARFENEVLRIY